MGEFEPRREAERAKARQTLVEEGDRYLAELVDEVGEPSADELARAEAIARRIAKRSPARPAG